jgi:hypothetical protein
MTVGAAIVPRIINPVTKKAVIKSLCFMEVSIGGHAEYLQTMRQRL